MSERHESSKYHSKCVEALIYWKQTNNNKIQDFLGGNIISFQH